MFYNMFFHVIDYTLVQDIPIEDSLVYGPEILEKNYENMARGFVHDPASYGAYPEVVSDIKYILVIL